MNAEWLEVSVSGKVQYGFTASGGDVDWHGLPVSEPNRRGRLTPTCLYCSHPTSPAEAERLIYLRGHLCYSTLYNFNVEAIRKPQKSHAAEYLRRDGANLSDVLEAMAEVEPEQYERVNQFLRAVVPQVRSARGAEAGG